MIARRVLETIRRHALLGRGARVVVALSGGSDSVALLRVLKELEGMGELEVAAAAHLNHGLRDHANREEEFCRSLAGHSGVTFRSDLVDVRGRAARERTSLEVAGRRARYELFDRVADEVGADTVATGHTRDDQAETFLLRLIRGAGPRGLGGIHPRSGRAVRPLLDLTRAELRAYLGELGQPFCEDPTNADVRIPRNRVRHELIPFLEARFSPRITGVLAREAGIARDDEECLQRQAIDLADSIVLSVRPGEHGEVGKVEIDARALGALHPALGARVARLALEKCAAGRFVNFDHTHRLLELASRGTGRGTVSLPGQRAVRQGDRLVLSRTQFSPFSNSFRVSLSIPGEVVLEAQGWAVSAGVQTERTTGIAGADRPCTFERLSVAVASAPLELPLGIRSRSRGDRFKPLGMGGHSKKLQDYLVDRKIERELRDSLPLVVDARDRIVWVVGEAVDEDFRVTGPSQAVIFLKARRLGGQG